LDELAKIRKDVESFAQEISREFYLQGAGLKQEVNFNKIYDKRPLLFTNENLGKIQSALKNNCSNRNELRRLRFFNEAFYGEIMGSLTRDHVSQYYQTEATGKITFENNKCVSYRGAMVELLNEKSRSRREDLKNALDEFTNKKVNPILESIFNIERNYVNEMGFPDKIEMFRRLSGIDLYSLDKVMQRFLEETEDVYVKELSKLAKEKLGLRIDELKKHDLLFLTKGNQFDCMFPKNAMIDKIAAFVRMMGIDISGSDNIVFDLEARENKSPRAFCSPVRIPNEVYLVIYPKGGEDDYTSFLHELGHALHFAHIDDKLEFEFKWYGDNSVTEGFAMTFDHMTMNENWTKSVLGFDSVDNPEYFSHRMMNELIMLRRYAAKIHYEIKLNAGRSLDGKRELYSSVFESATKIKHSPENYLNDVDPNFYCARYLRAWMFQAGMHKNMASKFDENWFEKPDAGSFLKELWSIGQKYNADEIAEQNGWDDLSINPLSENIMKYLLN